MPVSHQSKTFERKKQRRKRLEGEVHPSLVLFPPRSAYSEHDVMSLVDTNVSINVSFSCFVLKCLKLTWKFIYLSHRGHIKLFGNARSSSFQTRKKILEIVEENVPTSRGFHVWRCSFSKFGEEKWEELLAKAWNVFVSTGCWFTENRNRHGAFEACQPETDLKICDSLLQRRNCWHPNQLDLSHLLMRYTSLCRILLNHIYIFFHEWSTNEWYRVPKQFYVDSQI